MMKTVTIIAMWLVLMQTTLYAQYSDHRNRQVDSLEKVLATNPPTGQELAEICIQLSWGNLEIDMKKSMEYARKCIDVSLPLDNWKFVSDCYRVLGMHFWGSSQYDSAMVYFDKALEAVERMRKFPQYTEKDVDNMLSSTYGAIGNLFNIQGKHHEALEYYQKALKIFAKYDWKESQNIAYENIGQMYLSMGNYEQAEIYFLQTDSLAHILNNSFFIAEAKYSLSCLYLSTKEYDKALQNAEIAYDYYFSHPEEEGESRALILNVLAGIYLYGYDDALRAEDYARQALALSEELGIPREKSVSLRILSEIHLKCGQWRAAEQTALEALAVDDSEPTNTLVLYNILAKSFAHLGNASQAAEYIDKLQALQSLWSTKHYQSSIREMEVKYETEKKESRIAALESERRLWYGLATAGGVIVVLSLATLYFVWRWSKKRQQLVATQAVLDGETAERARIARDLHDGLGNLLSTIRYNMKEISASSLSSPADAERYANSMTLLDRSIDELRRVAHHLMPEALTRFGLKSAIGDYCKGVSVINFSWFGSESRFDAKTETVVYRIVHELVGNALKHSGATRILVQIVQEPARIALMVEDNGCGFDSKTRGKGMGLQNISVRVASFGGWMDIHSKKGEGTEVNVELRIEN